MGDFDANISKEADVRRIKPSFVRDKIRHSPTKEEEIVMKKSDKFKFKLFRLKIPDVEFQKNGETWVLDVRFTKPHNEKVLLQRQINISLCIRIELFLS